MARARWGRCLYTHPCIICSWGPSAAEASGVGAGRTPPDMPGDQNTVWPGLAGGKGSVGNIKTGQGGAQEFPTPF